MRRFTIADKQYEECQRIIRFSFVASGATCKLPIHKLEEVSASETKEAMIIALGKVG